MASEPNRPPVWQLGCLIPRLLIAVCLLDLGLRFVSIDPLTFRAWEAVTRYRPSGAAFEPNRRYYNTRAYGNLAALGNLPAFRQYRTEIFTSDALGFRNQAYVTHAEISAMLVGDSFAAGAGANDDETLAARLSDGGSCVVYNAGSEAWGAVPDRILALARRLNLRNRLIVRAYSEDGGAPALPTRWAVPLRRLVARTPAEVRELAGRIRGAVTVSPLQILSEHALKGLADDQVLPNGYAGSVVRARLANGDSMLFLASFVNNFHSKRAIDVDYWRWLREALDRAHFDLFVVLVPGKYTVYRPLLIDQKPVAPGTGDYLKRLERELTTAGIPVLNLTSLLTAEAARALERGEYLYWRDDIHWNARGIGVAAAAIRAHWPLTETSCRTARSLVVRNP